MADMTISNAYYKLNADNKIELYFEGREAYSSLDDAVKSDIKRSFVWGRRRKAWVSRTKGVGIPYQMDKYNIPFEGAGLHSQTSLVLVVAPLPVAEIRPFPDMKRVWK
mgnify:CR=1 FL=1